jgi:hypothetical protein
MPSSGLIPSFQFGTVQLRAVRRRVVALPTTGATLTVETTGLAAGVYVLHLQAGSSSLAKRIVVN